MTPVNDIEQLLAPHSPEVRRLVENLRDFALRVGPDLEEEVKLGWKNITYKGKGVVFAIQPYSKYVSLHFYKGVQLSDPQGVLEGGGKTLRHIKIHKPEDIRQEILTPLAKEAIHLDKSQS